MCLGLLGPAPTLPMSPIMTAPLQLGLITLVALILQAQEKKQVGPMDGLGQSGKQKEAC